MAAIRKIAIGLCGLLVAYALYMLYDRYVSTPMPIPADVNSSAIKDLSWFRQPGVIGQFEVYGADGLVYQQRGPDGRVIRQLGFQQLWHQGQDAWQVKEPFLRLYWQQAECLITADTGRFTVWSGADRPTPTGGRLWGNVMILIRQASEGSWPGYRMRMDDLELAHDRPLFTCQGTVEFEAPQGRWTGTQMELMFNQVTQRPQFLRLGRLDRLNWHIGVPAATNQRPTDRTGSADQTEYYQCLLRDQVRLETSKGVVFASAYVHMTGLDLGPTPGPGSSAAGEGGRHVLEELTASTRGPVMICPMDVDLEVPDLQGDDGHDPAGLDGYADGNQICVRGVYYDHRTGQILARGPVHMRLVLHGPAGQTPIPATISAAKQATCSAGQLVLDGPCQCVFVHQGQRTTTRYSLWSGQISATFTQRSEGVFPALDGIGHLRAGEGPVELRVESYTSGSQPGPLPVKVGPADPMESGARMVCQQMDWDAVQQVIMATGPGTIWLNHGAGRVDPNTRQPFYAMVRGFGHATYDLSTDRLSATGQDKPILVDYFPVGGGGEDGHIRAQAMKVELGLLRDQSGQLGLGTLVATGEVFYDDQENRFSGQRLSYDHRTGWMVMEGNDRQACSANGLSVLGIRFNLKTRQLQTTIVSPGMWMVR
ncbi:MAG: hypothetical protein QHH07_00630 [Sedimentisphaerales bacterium]|nr:hypothetical protein [Sedimentisphaerales bacterium]